MTPTCLKGKHRFQKLSVLLRYKIEENRVDTDIVESLADQNQYHPCEWAAVIILGQILLNCSQPRQP